MIDPEIRIPISGFPTAVTPDTCTCIIQDTNDSADLGTLRVMGNFRKKNWKKTATTELNIFLAKIFFSTENIQLY